MENNEPKPPERRHGVGQRLRALNATIDFFDRAEASRAWNDLVENGINPAFEAPGRAIASAQRRLATRKATRDLAKVAIAAAKKDEPERKE